MDKEYLKFKEFGKFLGSRPFGKKVRLDIINKFNNNKFVVFDFEGVASVTNSFADEVIAKLLDIYSIDELKKISTFHNMNDFVQRVILNAINERLKMNQNKKLKLA